MSSKNNKANGSRYEREFVAKAQDFGLVAARVPLSGAMSGYPGDVKVSDEILIECKSSRTGAGFKKLIQWAEDTPSYRVGNLHVYTLKVWLGLELDRVNQGAHVALCECMVCSPKIIESKSNFGFIHNAFDQGEEAAHFVACRMPRKPWIVIRRLEE